MRNDNLGLIALSVKTPKKVSASGGSVSGIADAPGLQDALDGKAPAYIHGSTYFTVPSTSGYEWTETVAAAGIASGQKILISLGAHSDSDENTAEMLDISCIEAIAGTDQITISASFRERTAGIIRFNYMAV